MSDQPDAPWTSSGPMPTSYGRSSMAARHVLSVVFAVIVTPIALMVFDYGADEYNTRVAMMATHSSRSVLDLGLIAVGGIGVLLVAVSGRVSGLGPVVAGVLYGVIPFLWFSVDMRSFFARSVDLPSTHLWFSAASYEFPLVAALLLGAGIAGRWRGTVRTQHWPS